MKIRPDAARYDAPSPRSTVAEPESDLRTQLTPASSEIDFPLIVQTLRPGWNLVGWSGATTGPDAFDFITGRFDVGFTYDAPAQRFDRFSLDAPEFLNTLERVDFGDGVWLFSDAETTWLQPAPWWQRDVELRPGFNLVLWTGGNNTPIDEAVAGLGSALVSLFTWDARAQEFRSYGPDRPPFLNTAEAVNYGDGVWLEVDRPIVGEQPPLQRVGTQDVWFIRKLARMDDGGAEVQDLTDAALAAASNDLGPPIPLQFGLVFQESQSLAGRVLAENGTAQPSVRLSFGVVSQRLTAQQGIGVDVVDEPADVFLGERFAVLAAISSAHLEESQYNIGMNDLTAIDASAIAGVQAGDELVLEFVFASWTRCRAG